MVAASNNQQNRAFSASDFFAVLVETFITHHQAKKNSDAIFVLSEGIELKPSKKKCFLVLFFKKVRGVTADN